ncbi:cadherin-13 isoform X3 [Turdus rufiventris]|nr:cadherin-13 isoform X3 [Turdus rufiventris]
MVPLKVLTILRYSAAHELCDNPGMKFDDCKGNNKLNFEVSNPDFAVELDGNLVALKNVSEVGKALFVHARSEHAEDMAEIFILEANEKRGALKEILKIEGNLGIPRQKRAILAAPILIPENQRPPFPRSVGKDEFKRFYNVAHRLFPTMQVIRSEGTEGVKFRLSGKGVDQDPKGIFRINDMNGDVSVTRSLDREAIANYELEVEVVDTNGKIIDGPVRLEIAVIDQNDNRPMFKEGPYVGHVMEGSATDYNLSVGSFTSSYSNRKSQGKDIKILNVFLDHFID